MLTVEKKRILSFIISCFLFIASFAQNDSIKSDSTKQRPYIRVSADLVSPLIKFYDANRFGMEFSLEYTSNAKTFFVADVGFHQKSYVLNSFDYKAAGMFGRFGVNKSVIKSKKKTDKDIFYLGMRLSAASTSHEFTNVIIEQSYWGDKTIENLSENFMSVWGEAVVGAKVSLYKNLYMGWDMHGSVMIKSFHDNSIQPIFIPGFGWGNKNGSIWMKYSLAYRFGL